MSGPLSEAWGINSRGQIVGVAATACDCAERAFHYWNGEMLDLGTVGGDFSIANAIKLPRHVVGEAYMVNDAELRAFLYAHLT